MLVPDPDPARPTLHSLRHAATVALFGYLALVLFMLAVGFMLTHPLRGSVGAWDNSVNRWFVSRRSDTGNSITGTATWFVNTLPAIGVAAVITAVLAAARRWREAAMLVLALALELSVFLTVNYVVGRPRPAVPRLDSTPSTSSFPSGHTAAATVLFAGLALIACCCTSRTVVRVLAFVFAAFVATLIGFARVYRGLHHPTDVFAGALLGLGCLVVAVVAVRATAPRSEPAVRTACETDERELQPSAA